MKMKTTVHNRMKLSIESWPLRIWHSRKAVNYRRRRRRHHPPQCPSSNQSTRTMQLHEEQFTPCRFKTPHHIEIEIEIIPIVWLPIPIRDIHANATLA
jgi:hypothetical protein